MKRRPNDCVKFARRLPERDIAPLIQYISDLKQTILLPPKEVDAIADDFLRLFSYYNDISMTVPEGIDRIGENILGGFFKDADPAQWYELDSAAKMYPLSMSHSAMAVFRISVYLKREVVPSVLQVALLSTIKRFPIFATTIRKGFFWHYIDATRRRFAVQEESAMPCMAMNLSGSQAVSFSVQYYGKRISLEVFHVLTDGAGALTFLKTLVREYLRLLGVVLPYDTDILNVSDSPRSEEMANDFLLADKEDKSEGFVEFPASQMKGRRAGVQPCKVLHFTISAKDLLEASKRYGTTVTGFVVSAVFIACAASLKNPKAKSRLHIQVPANMRAYYPSATFRNFSMYCIIKLFYEQITGLDEVIPLVKPLLKQGVCKESLSRMMRMTNALVNNPVIRYAPLALKRMAFRLSYSLIGERTQTTTLSNIGLIKNDFCGEVDRFEAIIGPNGTNKANCAMVSYGDKAVLSITKSTLDDSFERQLYRTIRESGVSIDVEEVSI